MSELEKKKQLLLEKKKKIEQMKLQQQQQGLQGAGKSTNVNPDDVIARGMQSLQPNQTQQPSQRPMSPLMQKSPTKIMKELVYKEEVGMIEVSAQPKVETFERGTNCDILSSTQKMDSQFSGQKQQQREDEEENEQALPQMHKELFNQSQILHQQQQMQQEKQEKGSEQELTPEDVEQITKSSEFLKFFNRCTKLVEKSLDSNILDLLEDRFQETVDVDQEDDSDPLHLEHKFFDQQYCANRVVSALQWSPNLSDIFLAAYSSKEEDNTNDYKGVVLLWSENLKSRPEFHCFCNSQITSACFYPFNNNIIIGGCYSGQIMIWDMRDKSTPAQRSSQDGHAYPIYSLNVVGTQNAHSIVSISNDGTLCTWNLNMLNQPEKRVSLKKSNNSEINATCMNFKQDEANNFFLGCEDGSLYSASLHSNKESITQTLYEGHQAPITAISQNNISENNPFMSNLVLTSSFDWNVKLWNPTVSEQCLYTFDNNEDYIYDVQWNRRNPCLFATADGEGYIDIWNLQEDLEMPVGRHQHSSQNSINKISWNQSGEKLLAGDSRGYVDLYNLKKKHLKYDPQRLDEMEEILKSSNSEN